jgi:hypothetical protein
VAELILLQKDKIIMKRVKLYSNALMVLTSIHHIYGAYIYHTPWRLHVLALSLPMLGISLLLRKLVLRSKSAFWVYWVLVLSVSVCLIGLYEGVYNHFLKNLLYYTGMPKGTMLRMFPPPVYEMPNDFLFEATGILQAILALILIRHFVMIKVSYNAGGHKDRQTGVN